jgi:hypothetical protein
MNCYFALLTHANYKLLIKKSSPSEKIIIFVLARIAYFLEYHIYIIDMTFVLYPIQDKSMINMHQDIAK